MKKGMKLLLGFLGLVVILIIIDIISIYTNFKPIFAVRDDYFVYRGLLYDTYVCPEYTVPVVKLKGGKNPCSSEPIVVVEIIDKTKDMKDFACAQALELIYEDDENYYYFSCIMSQYVVAKYSNGKTKNIKEVLANEEISIEELKNYGIDFIKKSKETEMK